MSKLGLKIGDQVDISVSKSSQLFPEHIPVIHRTEELKELFKKYPNLDRNYIASAAWADNRERMEKDWELFRPYADPAFLKDLRKPNHFRGRLWEMEFGCLLLQQGHKLTPKNKKDGPDLETPDFYVECVGARGDQGVNALSPPIADGELREVPHNKIKLRIANALDSKRKQYRNWADEGKINPDKPRVIAINLGALGWWPMMERGVPSATEEVLFGFGNEVIHIDRKTLKETGVSRELAFKLPKDGSDDVPVAFFNQGGCEDIAAVISAEAMFVNPESIEIVHNPDATKHLGTKAFKFAKQMVWTPEGGGLTRKVIDGR